MKNIKSYFKKIRLKINKFGAKKRNEKLKTKDFSIISNNCYAGIVYQHFNLEYNTPTIGVYFFPKEYIKFLEKFSYYINADLKFIETSKSKYYDVLKDRKQENTIIGLLDDVEIVFLHYKTIDEALSKWNKRKKRLSKNIIFKFNDQNGADYDDLNKFDKLPLKNKICFTSRKYDKLSSTIQIKKYEKYKEIKEDYYSCYKYMNFYKYVEDCIGDEINGRKNE